jgi:hypothetical protein
MNDQPAQRRAYFASLATPDLIVCATVERATFSAADIELIREELLRRGVDPERLAVPAEPVQTRFGPTPESFQGPLPGALDWWRESWELFTRHLRFLSLLALVIHLPYFLLSQTLGSAQAGRFSLGLIAGVFLLLAFDAVYAAAVLKGLCRLMTQSHCSVGRAVALGVQHWTRVFKMTLKAAAIAFGIPFVLWVGGQTSDNAGLSVLGVFLAIYPGVYLLLRFVWVQPLATLKPELHNPLAESRNRMRGRYRQVLGFLALLAVAGWGVVVCAAIVEAILPGRALDQLLSGYLYALFAVFTKTALLVGYLHLISCSGNGSDPAAPGAEAAQIPLPPPPSL